MNEPWHLLTGPTASGKSEAAVRLAEMLDAEIVSVDSMCVYRGMDIGTAKPSAELRARVPHHLVDVVDPDEDFSVARFVALARAAASEIVARGRRPLLVGGTPMYLRALLSGLFEGPSADWALRRELHELAAQGEPGLAELHRRLTAVDPTAAQRLHRRDVKRVVRALEVQAGTGVPISRLQSQWPQWHPAAGLRLIGLRRSAEDLRARLERRVEQMFARGLVDEVRALLARPGGLGRTARVAVGYAESRAHIEEGVPLAETIVQVKRRTWRVARKQMTWLRHLPGMRWLDVRPDEPAENVAQALYKAFERWHNHPAMLGKSTAAR